MNFDTELFLSINRALSDVWVSRFFIFITQFGDGLILALIILPLTFYFRRSRLRKHIVALVLSVAVSGLVINVMKVVVNRPRPPEYFSSQGIEVHAPLGSPSDRSFPSGHTQTAFGAATYLSCVYPPFTPIFSAMALLVGLSRMALGVHFPMDVFVGAAIGIAVSIIGFIINKRRLRASG